MLEVTDLSVSYGAVTALDGVSLSVPDNAITAVLGANGAGKTSLLRAISGLVRPQRGRVVFDGRDVTSWPAERIVRLGVAHVPEGRGIITELTVEENLRLGALGGARGNGGRRIAKDADFDEVYTMFPALVARRRQLAEALSGGERQMLAIGRALLSKPRLLLLDEPSLGLAPQVVAMLMRLLRELRDQRGLAVVLVEQNARSALSIADAAVVVSVGRVVVRGDPAEIDSDERLRHAYLGY